MECCDVGNYGQISPQAMLLYFFAKLAFEQDGVSQIFILNLFPTFSWKNLGKIG